jgi:hypothetical protein
MQYSRQLSLAGVAVRVAGFLNPVSAGLGFVRAYVMIEGTDMDYSKYANNSGATEIRCRLEGAITNTQYVGGRAEFALRTNFTG